MRFWDYDIESYPNVFCAVFKLHGTNLVYTFEVSDRVNQSLQFLEFLWALRRNPDVVLVGFNSIMYDYPVLHYLMLTCPNGFTAADVFWKSKQIIDAPWNDRFKAVIWDRDRLIYQLDLRKVHGFDNSARMMSLKMCEVSLRMKSVQDLPFPPETWLTPEQIPVLIAYNIHDVNATEELLDVSHELIDLRVEIGAEIGEDLLNKSDIDLGERLLLSAMEKRQPGITKGEGGRGKAGTFRSEINLAELVLPIVQFEHPEFVRIWQHFMTTPPIKETKGVFDDLECVAHGLTWVFGTGGIHAAVEGCSYRATDQRQLVTVDVASYYPNLSIHWGIVPAHLGEVFREEYSNLYERRKTYKKGTNLNTAIKLGLNASYGKSGSKFSALHDVCMTMGITINGQLLLCMLAEQLAKIGSVTLINVNTDGVTMAVDKNDIPAVKMVMKWWEELTRLQLDLDEWLAIYQRDVNSYLAVDLESGKVKGKGAFEWRTGRDAGANWHKDQSVKIVKIAAEERLVNGVPVEDTIRVCDDPFRFMHTLKVQRTDRAVLGGHLEPYEDWDYRTAGDIARNKPTIRYEHVGGVDQQKTGRFFASTNGDYLTKIMPPQKKLPNHYRPQAIESGQRVTMCNDVHFFDWATLDYDHYITKAKELVASTGTQP